MADAVLGDGTAGSGDTKQLFKMMEAGELDPNIHLPMLAKVMQQRSEPRMNDYWNSIRFAQGSAGNVTERMMMAFNMNGGERGLTTFWRTWTQLMEDSIPTIRSFGQVFERVASDLSGLLLVPGEFKQWIGGDKDGRNFWQAFFGDFDNSVFEELFSNLKGLNDELKMWWGDDFFPNRDTVRKEIEGLVKLYAELVDVTRSVVVVFRIMDQVLRKLPGVTEKVGDTVGPYTPTGFVSGIGRWASRSLGWSKDESPVEKSDVPKKDWFTYDRWAVWMNQMFDADFDTDYEKRTGTKVNWHRPVEQPDFSKLLGRFAPNTETNEDASRIVPSSRGDVRNAASAIMPYLDSLFPDYVLNNYISSQTNPTSPIPNIPGQIPLILTGTININAKVDSRTDGDALQQQLKLGVSEGIQDSLIRVAPMYSNISR